jgi:hypothetical protein
MAKKHNSFFASLEGNIRAASHEALIKSVVADPSQTIGGILDSLGEQEEAKYLLDAFKHMQVGEIVEGAVAHMQAHARSQGAELDVSELNMEPANNAPAAPTNGASKPKAKKSAPPRAPSSSAKAEAIDLSTPEKLKAYEAAILRALKDGKHVDEESALSSSHLRKIVGGTSDQARKVLDPLIHGEKLGFTGKARGTRYFIFA